MTYAQLAKLMMSKAKEIIESGRDAVPMLGMWRGHGLDLFPMPWRSSEEKALFMDVVRELLAKDLTISLYATVSEAWTSEVKSTDARVVEMVWPLDDPNRKEILIVTGFNRGGDGVFLTAEIKRLPDKKRRVMPPEEILSSSTTVAAGQMVNLFAPMRQGH